MTSENIVTCCQCGNATIRPGTERAADPFNDVGYCETCRATNRISVKSWHCGKCNKPAIRVDSIQPRRNGGYQGFCELCNTTHRLYAVVNAMDGDTFLQKLTELGRQRPVSVFTRSDDGPWGMIGTTDPVTRVVQAGHLQDVSERQEPERHDTGIVKASIDAYFGSKKKPGR